MIPIFLLTSFLATFTLTSSTKPYTGGQRIFSDAQAIDFIDPSKHGFHIFLRDDFITTHLQPVHAPTVYASAIALQQPGDGQPSPMSNRSNGQPVHQSGNGLLRTTKTLYPENGNPDDGLLDGKTIKLLGLREKTWYYVCVEFESNLRRHELVTGMSCQLKRTLDKFGQTVDSTVNEKELIEITDRSIAVRLTVNTDFPTLLHVYLSPDDAMSPTGATPPSQTFLVRPSTQNQNQRLRVYFGPFLQPETSYGQLCVIEEPKVHVYTAMGRAVRLAYENCHFGDLKTKPGAKQGRKALYDSPHSPQAQVRNYQLGAAKMATSQGVSHVQSSLLMSVIVIAVCVGQLTVLRIRL